MVIKNWEPFLYENCQPASLWVKVEGHENSRVGASIGHGEDTRLGVLVSPVLIGELVAVDRTTTGTLQQTSQFSYQVKTH